MSCWALVTQKNKGDQFSHEGRKAERTRTCLCPSSRQQENQFYHHRTEGKPPKKPVCYEDEEKEQQVCLEDRKRMR
jgi:hypothetical protein